MSNSFDVQDGNNGIVRARLNESGLYLANRTTTPATPAAGALLFAAGGAVMTVNDQGTVSAAINSIGNSRQQNLLAWTVEPTMINGSVALAAGSIYLCRVFCGTPGLIRKIWVGIFGGSDTTLGENWLGLYDAVGNRLALTADMTNEFQSDGVRGFPLTTPVSLARPGFVYVAALANGPGPPLLCSIATTLCDGLNIANAALSASEYRYAIGPLAQTTLPASINLSHNDGEVASIWAALS
jgi:hypothetical protein